MIVLRRFLWMGLLLVGLCQCEKGPDSGTSLKIEREYRAPGAYEDVREGDYYAIMRREPLREALAGGMERYSFLISPAYMRMLQTIAPGGGSGAVADPFAEPSPEDPFSNQTRPTLRDVFSSAGIDFGEGSSLSYSEETLVLTSINRPDQNDLIAAFLDSILICGNSRIQVRAEIFEVSDVVAAQVLDSAAYEANHDPERAAIVAAVERREAERIGMASLNVPSGQRAKIADAMNGETKSSETESEHGAVALPGLTLEVDPVQGADSFTVDLNLRLTHTRNSPAKVDAARKVDSWITKVVECQTISKGGSWSLVASWSVEPGRVQLVFVSATIQSFEEIRPVVKVLPE
jgi:hypothetical protein